MCASTMQLLGAWSHLLPPPARIGDVVDVVHGESAGHGLRVLPLTVLEGGVRRQYRQPLLQLLFNGFKLVGGQYALQFLLACVGYFGAYPRHRWRVQVVVEPFGGANLHLAALH